jgi:hypothetical protein
MKILKTVTTSTVMIGTIATFIIASSANAGLIITEHGTGQKFTNVAGATTFYDWDGINDTSIAATTLNGQANVGSNPGSGSGDWYSLSNSGQSVDVQFNGLTSYFGMFWGSMDIYNFVDFYSGANLLTTITGMAQVNTNGFIDFTADTTADQFDRVVLRSNMGAFEFDNFAATASSSTAVSAPSTLAIFALGLMGLASRRFKKKS